MSIPSPAIDISETAPSPRRRVRPWILLAVAVAIPVGLTLFGLWTSPPRVAGPPVGRLLYLDADLPSERTAPLRGLYVLAANGKSRLLLHEKESENGEGPREWVTQPKASPDGRQVAFIKQLFTLKEEKKSVVNQLWVMPMDGSEPPKLLLDLTAKKLKQIVGLAWTPDSQSVVFLNDLTAYEIRVSDGQMITGALQDVPPLKISPDISATRNPAQERSYTAITAQGSVLVVPEAHLEPLRDPTVRVFAVAPNGRDVAVVRTDSDSKIVFTDTGDVERANMPMVLKEGAKVHWGWSVFGGRKITSVKWSPDGKYLGYTVSKPPFPEDELFGLELATGKTFQMPLRAGRAAWDWSR